MSLSSRLSSCRWWRNWFYTYLLYDAVQTRQREWGKAHPLPIQNHISLEEVYTNGEVKTTIRNVKGEIFIAIPGKSFSCMHIYTERYYNFKCLWIIHTGSHVSEESRKLEEYTKRKHTFSKSAAYLMALCLDISISNSRTVVIPSKLPRVSI